MIAMMVLMFHGNVELVIWTCETMFVVRQRDSGHHGFESGIFDFPLHMNYSHGIVSINILRLLDSRTKIP